VAAPADFDMRLRARIAREKDAGARQPFIFRFAMTTPGIAVAALVVLAIASIVWINQSKQTASTPIATDHPINEKSAGTRPGPPIRPNTGSQPNEGLVATVDPPRTQKRLNPTERNPGKSLPVSLNPSAAGFRIQYPGRRVDSADTRSRRRGFLNGAFTTNGGFRTGCKWRDSQDSPAAD
jgi:hypothetical protein